LQRILIIEDEEDMVLGLRKNLEWEGFEVAAARDGEAGLNCALNDSHDLILLDIMLTARGQEIDKVLGLEIGADDYVTKPFSIRELLARVRAILRRASRSDTETEIYRFGDLELNFGRHKAQKRGQALELSPREFGMLRYFVQHRGETVTRDQLLDEVWGYDNFPLTRTVDNHIARLRQKIEENPSEPQHIITVHRIGYKFLG
jgi:DNA-binding response OmpR family regulator